MTKAFNLESCQVPLYRHHLWLRETLVDKHIALCRFAYCTSFGASELWTLWDKNASWAVKRWIPQFSHSPIKCHNLQWRYFFDSPYFSFQATSTPVKQTARRARSLSPTQGQGFEYRGPEGLMSGAHSHGRISDFLDVSQGGRRDARQKEDLRKLLKLKVR